MGPRGPSLESLAGAVHRWLSAPIDPDALYATALFRALVGGLIFLNFVGSAPFVTMWWSEHGLLPRAVARSLMEPHTWSLLDWLPPSDRWLWSCWVAALVFSALLAAGFRPRFQAACLFVLLLGFQHRNALICDAEDGLFRLFSFLLIFMPAAGDVWSLDAWLRRRRQRPPPPARGAWALRLAQFQVCLVLFMAGLHKLEGATWREGSALFYVFQLDDWAFHWPVPPLIRESLLVSKVLSWGTLTLELGAPVLIWFRETRRHVLFLLVLFHLGLEYAMNLFLFQWIMLAGWMTHADRSDLAWLRSAISRGQAWLRHRARPA